MTQHGTAWDILNHGDAIRARVARDRTSVASVAADAGLSEAQATKAAWLARVYDGGTRSGLGRAVLSKLTPMHLEVVAKTRVDLRDTLLRRAAKDRIAARDLRTLARVDASSRSAEPTSRKLEESSRALEIYAGFDDGALRRLLQGPSGPVIRRVATAGRDLAVRLSEFPTTT